MPSPPSVAGELPALRTGGGEGRKGGRGKKGEREEEEEGGNPRSTCTLQVRIHTFGYIHCAFKSRLYRPAVYIKVMIILWKHTYSV